MSNQDEDFAALLDASFAEQGKRQKPRLRPGQVVESKVVNVGSDTVFVDVGTRSEGQIPKFQLEDEEGNVRVGVGDIVRATVVTAGDRPTLVISFTHGAGGIDDLQLALESGVPVSGTVEKAIKGGLTVQIGKISAFCPGSQFDLSFTPDLAVYEGQQHEFRVIDIRDGGRSVVVSRRALLEAERAERSRATLERLAVGDEVDGVVQSLQTYGAFVDIGGIQGLAHISELGHGRVARVEDAVAVGEQVRVKVLGIDTASEGASKARPKIRLSLKALLAPAAEVAPGKILEAEVTKVESFGIFVTTEAGAGLVPTRELDLPTGSDPRRAYPVGKQIQVIQLAGDPDGRPRFSVKGVAAAEERSAFQAFSKTRDEPGGGRAKLGSFGALLAEQLGGADLPDAPSRGNGRPASPVSASGVSAEASPARPPDETKPGNRRRRVR